MRLTKTDKRVEGIYIEVCRKTKRGKEDINIDKLMISYMIHSKQECCHRYRDKISPSLYDQFMITCNVSLPHGKQG